MDTLNVSPAAPQNYQQRISLAYAPSSYQANVYAWVEGGSGNRRIRAVAGSGKTTTIVQAARLISGTGLFVAFNKSIAEALASKLVGTTMQASTIHSHGYACVRGRFRSARPDASKYSAELRRAESFAIDGDTAPAWLDLDLDKDARDALEDEGFPRQSILRLLDLARLDLVHDGSARFGEMLLELADRHEIDFAPELDDLVIACVRGLMQWGKHATATIDFTDMVWLPTALRLRPRTYAWVFVDEAQDLSRASLRLLTSSLREGGRMLFVGDPRQAIYGFAGADSDAWERIGEEADAPEMPLSVCYRCPTKVLDLAREIVPEIEARPGAPEGEVLDVARKDAIESSREGDLVLCRRNAPLLAYAFAVIASGRAACVKGRDIGKALARIAEDIASKTRSWADFPARLAAWADARKTAIRAKYKDAERADEACEGVDDQAECLRVVAARPGVRGCKTLVTELERIFSDEKASVTCSSIHRAKGLEARRVFVLEPEKLRAPRGRGWQLEQEHNLAYVAYTRAQETLVLVAADK